MTQVVAFGPRSIIVAHDTIQRWLLDIAPDSTIVYIGVVPSATASGLVNVAFMLSTTRDLVPTKHEIRLPNDRFPSAGTTGATKTVARWIGRFTIPRNEQYTLDISVHNRSGSAQTWIATVLIEVPDDE